MTVTWVVKVVEDWIRKSGGDRMTLYEVARRKFGRCIHDASHTSSYELGERVKDYLKGKDLNVFDSLELLWFFNPVGSHETGYNERLYQLLKEALTHVYEVDEDKYMKLHAKALVELIEVAEKLRSGIKCSGS